MGVMRICGAKEAVAVVNSSYFDQK